MGLVSFWNLKNGISKWQGRPNVVKGYGGWISIKNLLLDYWSLQTFEAIGSYFGGLESIATETLNLLIVAEKIQVKRNLCGFMPATIEISDEHRGNIFLNFGDLVSLDPPTKVIGCSVYQKFFQSNWFTFFKASYVAVQGLLLVWAWRVLLKSWQLSAHQGKSNNPLQSMAQLAQKISSSIVV